MYNQYNPEANNNSSSFENLIKVFKSFLDSERISKGSVRSYLSDVRHFLGWLLFFLESNHVIEKGTIDDRTSKIVVEDRKLKVESLSSNFYPQPPSSTFNHLSSVVSLLKHVNQRVLNSYKDYLLSNNVPLKTINRRFSSLRRFGQFCKSQHWLSLNPFDTLRNFSQNQPFPEDKHHLSEYRNELWKRGLTKVSLKNYLADVKQFILWSEKQKTLK